MFFLWFYQWVFWTILAAFLNSLHERPSSFHSIWTPLLSLFCTSFAVFLFSTPHSQSQLPLSFSFLILLSSVIALFLSLHSVWQGNTVPPIFSSVLGPFHPIQKEKEKETALKKECNWIERLSVSLYLKWSHQTEQHQNGLGIKPNLVYEESSMISLLRK